MKKLDFIPEISISEWKKLEWESLHFNEIYIDELWNRWYNFVGYGKIEGKTIKEEYPLSFNLSTERLYQKEGGQMYIFRSGIIAKVVLEGNKILAGEGKSEIFEEIESYEPKNLDKKIVLKDWKDGRYIVLNYKDGRILNFLKEKGCKYEMWKDHNYIKVEEKYRDILEEVAKKRGYFWKIDGVVQNEQN